MNYKIAVHITHYQDGRTNLKRNFFLKRAIISYLQISKNVEIFIHSNKKYIYKHKSVKCFVHNNKNEHPFYLSWKYRNLMQQQKNLYDFYIYSEDDILFTMKNFLYWKKNYELCTKNFYNLGFIRVENRMSAGLYAVDLFLKLKKFITLNQKKFIINDVNPYCALWIMDNQQFNEFIKTKIWKFDWKTSYQAYGDIRAMSAMGWHGLNCGYYKSTIIPLKNYKMDNDCIITHLDNRYSITKHGPGSINYQNLLDKNLIEIKFFDILKIEFLKYLKKVVKKILN